MSICFCIEQDLAEPLRRQLYQTPVSKHFLASAIPSAFHISMWGNLFMTFLSDPAPLFVPVFPLDRSNSGLKFWRLVSVYILQLGGHVLTLDMVSTGSLSTLLTISANVIPVGPGRHLGLSGCYPHFFVTTEALLHASVPCPVGVFDRGP